MARRAATRGPKASYGIAEWYGRLFKNLGPADYAELSAPGRKDCPFLLAAPDIAPRGDAKCQKPGGVCSIRNFITSDAGDVTFGDIVTTCPNRFLQDRTVLSYIGDLLLDADDPVVLKEIPFLKRVSSGKVEGEDIDVPEGDEQPADVVEKAEDVGSIDLVLMHPDAEPKRWAAVEMQAVYFSGGAMSADFEVIKVFNGNGLPMPAKARRHDFRSSGPKRLMPQLQIKVPSLRRWGKKTVVIIDKPFLNSMAEMREVKDVSNADIVWVVVNYREDPGEDAVLYVEQAVKTTLEDSVIGLTAGEPTTLSDFEGKLAQKIDQRERAARRRAAAAAALVPEFP